MKIHAIPQFLELEINLQWEPKNCGIVVVFDLSFNCKNFASNLEFVLNYSNVFKNYYHIMIFYRHFILKIIKEDVARPTGVHLNIRAGPTIAVLLWTVPTIYNY